MSVEAFSYVLNHVPIGGNPKVILLGIANHAHPDGTNAYPSMERLAGYAHVDRRTAQRNVRKLEEDGFIEREGFGPMGQVRWRVLMESPAGVVEEGGGNLPPAAPVPPEAGGGDLPRGGGSSDPDGAAPAPPEPSIEPSGQLLSLPGADARAPVSQPRAVRYRGQSVPPPVVDGARTLLADFNAATGRALGDRKADASPSPALLQIIGAVLARPEVPLSRWRAAVARTCESPPEWVRGPVQIGHVFGERAAEWALADPSTAVAPAAGSRDARSARRRSRGADLTNLMGRTA